MPITFRLRLGLASALLCVAMPLAAQAAPSLAPRTRGAATAPITVYEMSDFQCPYCRRFALNTFPDLDREYIATGKVRWVFINFPLTMIHPNAAAAAEVAMCAAKTGQVLGSPRPPLPEPADLGTAHRAGRILPDAGRLGVDPARRLPEVPRGPGDAAGSGE